MTKRELSDDDKFLLFLEDGETWSEVIDSTVVVRGNWTKACFADGHITKYWTEDYPEDGVDGFQYGVKEELRLSKENLQKIRTALPELWEIKENEL